MRGDVLISSDTGSGFPADEALLAAALRLLERGTWAPCRCLSLDLSITSRAHPHVNAMGEEDLQQALSNARLLVVIGDLTHRSALERAARHVLHAKHSGVPVALVSVRIAESKGDPHSAACLEILAQAESISTCDGHSASVLSRGERPRISTTAPLELILVGESFPDDPKTLTLEEEFLEEMPARERDDMLQAVADFAQRHEARAVVVCATIEPRIELPDPIECVAVREWSQWMRALSHAHVCIGRPDRVAVHIAVAHGAVPLSWQPGGASELHERLGLGRLASGMCGRSWGRLLDQAWKCSREEMLSRSAPLRVVAWRALGPLADAVRSHPLQLDDNSELQVEIATILHESARIHLECGNFVAAEEILDPWQERLASQPRWASARARAWSMQGADARARQVLEHVLMVAPEDAECWSELGRVLWRLGEAEAAERCWNRIVDLGGDAAIAAQDQIDSQREWCRASGERWAEEAGTDASERVHGAPSSSAQSTRGQALP